MQVFVELRYVVLEKEHTDCEECHLDEVAQAHRLKPDFKPEPMWSDISSQVTFVVEATFLLKVSLAVHLAKCQIPIRCTVLKKAAANVYFTSPSVFDYSVSNSRLHCPVHRKFCHQRQCIVVF